MVGISESGKVVTAIHFSCEKALSTWSPTIGALMSARKRAEAVACGDIAYVAASLAGGNVKDRNKTETSDL